jgi:TolB-like protein/DNA-binding winged helix-turn-helix (wHTH) protein/Tfp pilus assembly protein PilF
MLAKTALPGRAVYRFGPFLLDAAERRLSREGVEVALTRKSFDLLVILLEHAGRLQSRDALYAALWPDTIVEEHTLTWHLSALRRALGDTGDAPQYIETVRGHGYRFIAAVQKSEVDAAAAEAAATSAIDSAEPMAIRSDGTSPESNGSPLPPSRPSWRLVAALALASIAAAAAILAWRQDARRIEPAASAPASPRSIAVLPFENLSTDPANAYFASGIQETILAQLAGIGDLRVVSRRSTDTYGSRPLDLAGVARQLDVGSVLEGNVQKSGAEVMVNVQLIDPASGTQLWAHSYRRTLADVFAVQSDVAGQVAAALQAKLLPADQYRFARLPTNDAGAYDLFLRAEYSALRIEMGTANDRRAATAQARALYEQAIARDPRFALAYARLSYLESHAYWLPLDHTPERAAAGLRAARRALELDPDLAQSHLAMGYAHYYGRRDYPSALQEFRRALRDMPNNADINASIANIQRRRGAWREALAGYSRAEVLDPRNPQWPMLVGDTLTNMGRYTEADGAYERALVIDPHSATSAISQAFSREIGGNAAGAAAKLGQLPADANPDGYATTARFVAAWLRRDPAAAIAVLDGAPSSIEAPWTPSSTPTDLLRAQALELAGDAAAAREAYARARNALAELLRNQPDDPASMSLLALAEAGLGNTDAALAGARRAADLLPLAEDAVDGPCYLLTLAEVEIRVGDMQAAVALLRHLLDIPAGREMSASLFDRDPRFDAVREAVLRAGATKRP